MEYVLFFLAAYSFACIVVEQKIFQELRDFCKIRESHSWYWNKVCKLVHCIYCVGFWAGFILTLLGFNIININYLDPFFAGLISSVVSYFIHNLFEYWVKVSGVEL